MQLSLILLVSFGRGMDPIPVAPALPQMLFVVKWGKQV